MRLGDADRDRLAADLGQHFVAGRIDADELDRRLGVLYGEGEAEALNGLPPLPAPSRRSRRIGRRRHGEVAAAEPDWRPTTERFVDPTTRRLIRVWLDARDDRRYVPEPPAPGG